MSLRTAQRWMKRMKYRWQSEPKSIYCHGHERQDVVNYRQNVFLLKWASYAECTRKWTRKGGEVGKESKEAPASETAPEPKKTKCRLEEEQWEEWEEEAEHTFIGTPDGKVVVIWGHDESIFYAHDRRKIRWVHLSETAKPKARGEGGSMMVIAFVSPDYGWEARLTMWPGKNRDGYYSNGDILEHVIMMMDRLESRRDA
ncbi:hypothetical protein DFH09DRAFT_1305932 [Mycena vulgaris]|nr:hypothetical protein DFH09DRAFT_1305932 [Mycena vulgaris]